MGLTCNERDFVVKKTEQRKEKFLSRNEQLYLSAEEGTGSSTQRIKVEPNFFVESPVIFSWLSAINFFPFYSMHSCVLKNVFRMAYFVAFICPTVSNHSFADTRY